MMTSSTVSIQKIADICSAWAFGLVAPACPSRKAMLSTPPPKEGGGGGGGGAVEMMMAIVFVIFCLLTIWRSTVFGSSRMACVMVPAAMNLVRSCGILGVFGSVAVWLGNRILLAGFPVTNGVMSTGSITGGPA